MQNEGMAGWHLALETGESTVRDWAITKEPAGTRIEVGCDPARRWQVTAAGVRPFHFELYWDGQTLWVTDPANHGVMVNGHAVVDWQVASPGALIEFGSATIHVRQDDSGTSRVFTPPEDSDAQTLLREAGADEVDQTDTSLFVEAASDTNAENTNIFEVEEERTRIHQERKPARAKRQSPRDEPSEEELSEASKRIAAFESKTKDGPSTRVHQRKKAPEPQSPVFGGAAAGASTKIIPNEPAPSVPKPRISKSKKGGAAKPAAPASLAKAETMVLPAGVLPANPPDNPSAAGGFSGASPASVMPTAAPPKPTPAPQAPPQASIIVQPQAAEAPPVGGNANTVNPGPGTAGSPFAIPPTETALKRAKGSPWARYFGEDWSRKRVIRLVLMGLIGLVAIGLIVTRGKKEPAPEQPGPGEDATSVGSPQPNAMQDRRGPGRSWPPAPSAQNPFFPGPDAQNPAGLRPGPRPSEPAVEEKALTRAEKRARQRDRRRRRRRGPPPETVARKAANALKQGNIPEAIEHYTALRREDPSNQAYPILLDLLRRQAIERQQGFGTSVELREQQAGREQ